MTWANFGLILAVDDFRVMSPAHCETACELCEELTGPFLHAHTADEVTQKIAKKVMAWNVAPNGQETIATIAAVVAGQQGRLMLALAIDTARGAEAAVNHRPTNRQLRPPKEAGRTGE